MADEGDREEVTRELLDEVEAGLVDDRRALLIKMPFIGSVLMHLDLEARAGMEMGTAATDGSTIMFDPHFYKKLKPEERLFVLAHETWHCALLHFARTGSRHPEVANIAQDLEIHFVLMDELAEAIPEIDAYPKGSRLQLELRVKYEGYISRQDRAVDRFTKLEGIHIPEDFDYDKVDGISSESREKLKLVRPDSIGQASRISGVRTSDITVLLVYLRK